MSEKSLFRHIQKAACSHLLMALQPNECKHVASPSRKQSKAWNALPPGKLCQTLARSANERRSRLHSHGIAVDRLASRQVTEPANAKLFEQHAQEGKMAEGILLKPPFRATFHSVP